MFRLCHLFIILLVLSVIIPVLHGKVLFHSGFEVGHTALKKEAKPGIGRITVYSTLEFDQWPSKQGKGVLSPFLDGEPFSFSSRIENTLTRIKGIEKRWPENTLVHFAGFNEWHDYHKKIELKSRNIPGNYYAHLPCDLPKGNIFLRCDFQTIDDYYCRFNIMFSDSALTSLSNNKLSWFHDVISNKTGVMRVGLRVPPAGKQPVFCLRFHTSQGSKGDIYLMDTVPVQPNRFYCVEYHFSGNREKGGGAELWVDKRKAADSLTHNTRSYRQINRIFFGITSWARFNNGHMGLDDVVISENRIGPVVFEQITPDEPAGSSVMDSAACPVETRIVDLEKGKNIVHIVPGVWYRLLLETKTKPLSGTAEKYLIRLDYLPLSSYPGRAGFADVKDYFWEANVKSRTLTTRFAPDMPQRIQVTGQKHDYLDDSQGQYRVDSKEGRVEMVFRLLENARQGPWKMAVTPIDTAGKELPSMVQVISVGPKVQSGKKGSRQVMAVIIIIGILTTIILVLIRILRKRQKIEISSEDRSAVVFKQSVDGLIQSHYTDESFSREFLAEKLNMSVSELSRKFKREMGTTFPDYLNMKRLGQAKHLLINSDKKIFEIAFEVGYSNVEHFNSVFKRYEKMSPNQFREKSVH
jgi:AraC-like DNA-binding protein